MTATHKTVQVYRVFIKATPEAIWDAITKPEWTQRYGYRSIADFRPLEPGGSYIGRAIPQMQAMGMPEEVVDGEIIEVIPNRRLVHTWRFLWDDQVKAEGPTRVTFDIKPIGEGVCRFTITHELENAPVTAAQLAGEIENAGGGWAFVISDLKSLLETGSAMEIL